MTKNNPFRYFKTKPEISRLAVMPYTRFPPSLMNVEDLLHERGIYISHETVRFLLNRFGPLFVVEIRRKRINRMRSYSNWQRHLDEVFVKTNGETHYLWRAADHEGEVLETYVTKRRDHKAALKFLRKKMKHYGSPSVIATDRLRSYGPNGAYPTLEGIIRHHLDPIGAFNNRQIEQAELSDVPWLRDVDYIAFQDIRERDRLKANIDIRPLELSTTEVTELVAFLHTLTGGVSVKGRLGRPENVPSGLEVD